MDELANSYMAIMKDLGLLRTPFVFNRPSSLFTGPATATNQVSEAFAGLNRLLASLGLETSDFKHFIDNIRDPKTSRSGLTSVLIEASDEFHKKKGTCMHEVLKKLEELGLEIPPSRFIGEAKPT